MTPRTGAVAGNRNPFHLGVAEHPKAAACKADVRTHRVGESPTSESNLPAWRNLADAPGREPGDESREGSKPSAGTNTVREYANRKSGSAQSRVFCPFDSDLAHQDMPS
jgi:hypothetical protein